MKKQLLSCLLVLASMCLGACNQNNSYIGGGGNAGDDTTSAQYYTITWKNWNGTTLEVDRNVRYGSYPSYDSTTPTRASDSQYTYTFSGWSPSLRTVTSDMTYTATFNQTLKKYTITWKNWDNSTLEIDYNVPYGSTPSYDGVTPTRSSDSSYSYSWIGWTPTITAVNSDKTYYANYSTQPIKTDIECILYLDLNGGTSPSHPGITISQKTVKISEITSDLFFYDCIKTGYEFAGWAYNNTLIFNKDGQKVNDCGLVAKMLFKAKYDFSNKPVFSGDGKTVIYGYYPQSRIRSEDMITSLNNLSTYTTPNSAGWYLYNDEYYTKVVASTVYDYWFDDGGSIKAGNTYWFKCEPVTWNILSKQDGKCLALSSVLLDSHCYNNTLNKASYNDSDVRSWLIGNFYNSIFFANNSSIQTTMIDGVQNNIFLLSKEDYLNTEYGFPSYVGSSTGKYVERMCKTTDWARARGAYMNKNYNYGGYYLTRTITSNGAMSVYPCGSIGIYNNVNSVDTSIRPAITLTIS